MKWISLFGIVGLSVAFSGCKKFDRGVSCVPAWNEAECHLCCENMGLEFSEFFMIELDRGECFCKEPGEE